ncbi:MAG: hypothetical protein A2V65_05545 [Deltaproteobacteria bacterium RBG_13_49_15]|nr:MAG: hypothetical protein A2V65_05545 [Deltaproteobacteria bacterium RBG_13_49_15]
MSFLIVNTPLIVNAGFESDQIGKESITIMDMDQMKTFSIDPKKKIERKGLAGDLFKIPAGFKKTE